MRAGKLFQSVILQSPTGSRDALGQRTTSWSNVATVRASVDPLNAREVIAASQAHMDVTHRVIVRYDSAIAAITHGWRVLFGSRVLVIEGIRNIGERNRSYELLCSEGLRDE